MRQNRRRRDPWLPHPPSRGALARVFLIPYSGCGASMYRRWPRCVDGVDLLPVELPGHETRFAEPTFETYQELGAQMAAGLAQHLDVPFAFFGHCGSALAAYEVSVELARSGPTVPARLFVSSQVAPQDGPRGRFLELDDAELGAEVAELIRASGGVPGEELVELYLEVMRADVEANRRYVVPDPMRLPLPVTVIGWSEDTDVPFSTMTGWGRCGDVTSVVLDGGHHRFTEAPTELLALLTTHVLGPAVAGAGRG